MQLDAAGNIYLAGSVIPQQPKDSQDGTDAFVAKLSPDGSKLIYFVTLSGSFTDDANALVLGVDGSAYIAGSTGSSDFPVTSGAYQTGFNPLGASQGFLAKISPSGAVVYASFIGGPTFTTVSGIALGKGGEVFVTGTGGPDYPVAGNPPPEGFILKLDAAMSNVLLSVYGYGGGLIALDSQGNLYLAGTAQPSSAAPGATLPPLSAGAFQTTHAAALCSESAGHSGAFASFCPYQYVAKLDASGKLLWGTYVTGTYGATPAGIAVDNAGNVIVAGTTNSSDYPVTPGAFQTAYTPAAPPPPIAPGFVTPPNATGYVTKVNSGGTALMWSTYFGGSFQDQITGMAINSSGEIFLSGRAGSADLVEADTPDGCRPSANQVLGFVARLSADGSSAAATQLVNGAPDCTYFSCGNLSGYQRGWPLVLRPDGTALVAGSNGSLASLDFSASQRVACVTDPADNVQLGNVSPGEVISLFGIDLAPASPSTPEGGVAASTDSFGIFFNGIAAPVLYSAGQQINVQVPYEIAGAGAVSMKVVSQNITHPFSETRTLAVADRQPSIFLSRAAIESPIAGFSVCGDAVMQGEAAMAINPDGTINDCTNPAPAGSTVTVMMNGLGITTPGLGTGAIVQGTPAALAPGLDPGPFTGTTTMATQSLPGAISGVAQVQLRGGTLQQLLIDPALGGVPLRERVILVWTR